MSRARLTARLRAVRDGGDILDDVPEAERPATLAAAYAIADALTAGQKVGGFKIGATSQRGRDILGLAEPFYGRILADGIARSPATLHLTGRTLALEAEIGCELGSDLPPRTRPYTRAEVISAVRKVIPLIEINAPSYKRPLEMGGLCLIADNGVNAGAVLGTPGSVSLDAIRDAQVAMKLDGELLARGTSAASPDDPLSALCWLANTLSQRKMGLFAGQVIATGAMAAPVEVDAEHVLEADFAALGAVQIAFVR